MELNYKEKLKTITTFFFDVDGVLTDGTVMLLPGGEQARRMNIKDGYALQLAIKQGFKICIITGGKSELVKQRMAGLGITDVYLNVQDKVDRFEDYFYSNHLKIEETLYMGDDMPDWEVMQKVYLAACPNDSVAEIKKISHYISPFNGGQGCVRDIIEQVLKIQGKWEHISSVKSTI
ncbi:MAG: 3-deoxy-D-manno-octulosonate 8-phosphate phosphatase [Bacteroidetes bacterium]|nr:3-deoxy-D-manno-octulosonate 8-phosphate phosphatase [Bacteroidota bacterium]